MGDREDRRRRSRSRSPRERRRGASPDRRRDRRSRSRSPRRRDERTRRRSPPPADKARRHRDYDKEDSGRKERRTQDGGHSEKRREKQPAKVNLDEVASLTEEEMMRQMGFTGFDTTKNKKVEGNVSGAAKVHKTRKYRQYMNRKGGFNRPLDYIA